MVRPLDGGRRRLGGWGQCQSKDWDLYLPTPSSPPSGHQGDMAGQPAGSDFMTQLPGGMKRERTLTGLPASLLHARTHARTHTLTHTPLSQSPLLRSKTAKPSKANTGSSCELCGWEPGLPSEQRVGWRSRRLAASSRHLQLGGSLRPAGTSPPAALLGRRSYSVTPKLRWSESER